MMAAVTPTIIHLLARVGDSEVLNEIGTFEIETEWRLVGTEDTGAAVEATSVITLDLARALREAADRIEAGEISD